MKHLPVSFAISMAALLGGAGTADAQQPPDVVQSDDWANTAMGSDALLNVTPNSCEYCGIENTAAGAYAMQSNTSGGGNVAMGFLAMQFNVTGHNNTGVGDSALQDNTTGYYNTAFGSGALLRNTTAWNNTGLGLDTLIYNTTGANNTATGANALFSNTTAGENTATGYNALYTNTTGAGNTSSGAISLYSNTTGNNNTATGYAALQANTNGASNTAAGNHTLYSNTTGYHDTADGAEALFSNTTGSFNTAVGMEALFSNKAGSGNVAVGASAGYLTTGSNNIDIGNQGAAGDSGTIRVGTPGTQTVTYIAGIENSKLTGSAVYVTAQGQLGVLASSERYKTAVASMDGQTDRLQQLRPVTFHLKTEPQGEIQYGLIAEEVARVYPELVIRDEAGAIQGVRYDELAPMLLNEVQRQAAEIRELKQQQTGFATQADLADLQQQLHAALAALHSEDKLLAHR